MFICHLSVLSNSQSIFVSYLFHKFYKKKKKGKGSIPFRKIVRDVMVHYDLVLISMQKVKVTSSSKTAWVITPSSANDIGPS